MVLVVISPSLSLLFAGPETPEGQIKQEKTHTGQSKTIQALGPIPTED